MRIGVVGAVSPLEESDGRGANRFLWGGGRVMRFTLGAVSLVACMMSQPGRADGGLELRGDPNQSVTNIIGTGSQVGEPIAPNFRLRIDPGSVAVRPAVGSDAQPSLVRRRYAGTMVDFYPLGGEGFHLSAGGRLDNRRKVRDFVTSNALLYAPRGFGARKGGNPKRLASAMTVGYGSSPEPGVSLGLEAGAVMEHGDPSTRELNRFAHRSTRNDGRFTSEQRFNPVVQASLGYKF
jgi:hypothetical protein